MVKVTDEAPGERTPSLKTAEDVASPTQRWSREAANKRTNVFGEQALGRLVADFVKLFVSVVRRAVAASADYPTRVDDWSRARQTP
jgi:hypothetical protein